MRSYLRSRMRLRSVLHNMVFGGRERQAGTRQQTKSDTCNSLLHVLLPAPLSPVLMLTTGSCEGTPECLARLLQKRKSRLLQHILQSSELSLPASASSAVIRHFPARAGSPPGCPSSREMSPTTAAPAPASTLRSICGKSRRRTPTPVLEQAPASAPQTRTAHTLRV